MSSRLSGPSNNLTPHAFSNVRKTIAIVFALFIVGASLPSFGQTSQIPFNFPDLGATSVISGGTSGRLAVGDASIQVNTGSATPSGVAIFGLRETGVLGFGSTGVLVTEAGVPATPLIQTGRVYVQLNGVRNTGIAMANPGLQDAVVSFNFTDTNGNTFGAGNITVPAGQQIAKFLNEAPFNSTPFMEGTFTFSSSVPVTVIALRTLVNERGDFLVTTLPVADLSASPASSMVVLPQFADGGGWVTSVILVNPTANQLTGTIQFLDPSGSPVSLSTGGGRKSFNSTFNYTIPGNSSFRLSTAGSGSTTQSGSVHVVPGSGTPSPIGLAVYSFNTAGITATEAGVPSISDTAFRAYVETSSTPGAVIQSGLAIANVSTSPATVNLQLFNPDGTTAAAATSLTLPGSGQTAKYLSDLFPNLPQPFQGVVRISAASSNLAVVGLRTRYNERGDYLITTTPPTGESATPGKLYFPHLAIGGGYTTQLILFSGTPGSSSSGTLNFFSQSGAPWAPLTTKVTAVSSPTPVVNAGPNQTITLPSTASLSGTATGFPAGSTLTVTWSKVSGPGTVAFGNVNALSTTASFSAAGTYVVQLSASGGGLTSTSSVTITVNAASTTATTNQAPTVNAGSNQTITLPSSATLSGTATDDGLPSGSTLTTTWSKISGPGTVTFGNVNAKSTTASFSVAGTYVLQLAASDTALTSTSTVTITVNAAPTPPTVSAGPNQTITLPASANLSGTATGSGTLTTTWSKVSGPGTVTFGNPNATSTTASFSTAGSYVLQLAASNSGGTSTSTVTITVNAAPTTTTSAKLLFKSGFESGSTMGPTSNDGTMAAGANSTMQMINGVDSSTGYNWSTLWSLFGTGFSGIHLIPGNGMDGQPFSNAFQNTLDTTNKHAGSQSLKMNESGFTNPDCNSACGQATWELTGSLNIPSMYERVWVYIPSSALTKMKAAGSDYEVFFEFKSTNNHRMITYMYYNSGVNNNNLYWHAQSDDLTDVHSMTQTYWQADNTAVPVPLDQWFQMEWYFKIANDSTGRYFWGMTDPQGVKHTLVDRPGPNWTIGSSENIAGLFLMNLYGGHWPLVRSLDDLEIWDSPTCSTLPCGAN